MVSMNFFRRFSPVFLSISCLVILTGCPGPGDRMRMDETTSVEKNGDNICMSITNAEDYQPADMGINLRGTPSKEKNFNFSPGLKIVDGILCIPPSFYQFKNGNKYIIEFALYSARNDESRSFVVGVGINNDKVYNFGLTGREISRPYGSIEGVE